jgi:alcohol dehydrogenase (cytochrome c)
MGAVYFKGEAEFKEGSPFTGGGEKALRDEAYGAVRALDVLTGKKVWEFKLNSPAWAGLLSTAGGLVFGGSDEGNLYALDAATGKPVWDFQSGGRIRASPISFLMDGKQVVAVSANRVLYVFGL